MPYEASYALEETGVFLVVYFAVMLLSYGLMLACYILRSLGVYTIAKRRGIHHPWMAWVPVVDQYLLGCVADQYQYVVKGKNTARRKALLTLQIIMIVLVVAFYVCFFVFFLNMLSWIAGGTTTSLTLFSEAMSGAELLDPQATVMLEEAMEGMIGFLLAMLGLSLPMLGVSIALMVVRYVALHDLYASCNPDHKTLFLVLSILFSVTEPFFIFFNRKKDGGMPPRLDDPVYIPEPPVWQPPEPQPYTWQPPTEPAWQSPAQPYTWQPPQPPMEPWENPEE